jgi:monovalent cation:proton antiporter-2 (CPA2) family protein
MASAASHASFLPPVLTFCAAAVVAVPLCRRLGQSAVIGYLAAGVVIGPSGLSLIAEPETAGGVAELGVVLLLFIIGLELKLSRLLSMRRDIFGLGLAQLAVTGILIALAAAWAGLSASGAFATGIALGLSATAIALQILEEREDLQSPYGQKSFAVLLFQDLSIVPILALLPLLATAGAASQGSTPLGAATAVGVAVAAIAGVVVIGRYGLNPFFRLLASSGAREVLTASALLVVLGTALLMERVGLSMAMGAFLAGVLLAESNFRHQLEADIEPFRGILLGLFFMSVGMSIDAARVRQDGSWLLVAIPALVGLKIAVVSLLFRAVRLALARCSAQRSLACPRRRVRVRPAASRSDPRPDRGCPDPVPDRARRTHHAGRAARRQGARPCSRADEAGRDRARSRGFRGFERARPGDRLRPLRAGGEPGSSGARHRRHGDRQERRPYPRSRALRLQGLLRRRPPAGRAPGGGRAARAGDLHLRR